MNPPVAPRRIVVKNPVAPARAGAGNDASHFSTSARDAPAA